MEEQESSIITIKTPKKILHFSDGTLEIFDEDDEKKPEPEEEPQIDEKTLDWTPWLFYKAQRIGSNVLAGIDNTGEKLADFFGITSPKYAYEIRQYQKEQAMKAEDEKVEKDNTWEVSKDSSYSEPITSPPSQSRVLEV